MKNETSKIENKQSLNGNGVVTIPSTGDHLSDALWTTELCFSIVNDLGALFKAIKKLSDKNSASNELAKIGKYLSEDWSNMLDCERETLQEKQDKQKQLN